MTRPDDRPPSSDVWLQVVSATDYLGRGHRRGLTVWDAVEEAVRWYTAYLVAGDDDALAAAAAAELPWDDPDPLRTALERLVLHHPPATEDDETIAEALHNALRAWLDAMSAQYNEGAPWGVRMLSGDLWTRFAGSSSNTSTSARI